MEMNLKISDIAKINESSIGTNDEYEFMNYLDTGSIFKNKIQSLQYLTNGFPSRAKRKVKSNTIIYSTVRPNQEHFGIFDNITHQNLIVSTGFTTIDVTSDKIFPKYLYYLLSQSYVTEYLHTIAENSVSAYPSINPSDLANLTFKFPKIELQKEIVKKLEVIDCKITLNEKINDNLPNNYFTFTWPFINIGNNQSRNLESC
jgi:type I restriction enzyme S subunit